MQFKAFLFLKQFEISLYLIRFCIFTAHLLVTQSLPSLTVRFSLYFPQRVAGKRNEGRASGDRRRLKDALKCWR